MSESTRNISNNPAISLYWVRIYLTGIMPIFEESNIPKVDLFKMDIVIYLTTRKPAMYLTQPLHRAAQQNPKKLAVKFLDRQFTFEQIFNRVSRLAGALRQLD